MLMESDKEPQEITKMVIANADTSTAVGEEMISSDTQGLASAASMWTASGVAVFRWVFLSLH